MGEHPEQDLPGDGQHIDFSTYVLSMSTSCMVQLGELPHPDGHADADLRSARDTLEILLMLEERTHGNLSGEECRLLTHVIEDLKPRYLAKVAKVAKEAGASQKS